MEFTFLDPHESVSIGHRKLPHWEQSEKSYFITFRTVDSLPEHVVASWREERDQWLRINGIKPNNEDWHSKLQMLPSTTRLEFHRRFSERFHDYLDDCHGECLLRNKNLADVVKRSLLHFDGDRYHMGDFVVMPNHVHLLVRFLGSTKLAIQCRSWKKFTAGEINKALGRRGHFWQGESYDHLLRGPEELWHYQEYIAENPKKAKLSEGEFFHFRAL